MKKLFSVIVSFAFALSAWAQTPEAILAKMEEVINQREKEGVSMVVETKIPVMGTIRMSSLMLGNKARMESKVMGYQIIIWDDGETEYTYNTKSNEIDIVKSSGAPSQDSGDMELFSGITQGYDVSIKKETADAWHILCKKAANNPNKDDPKTMDVVVAKGTYHPISLSTKVDGIKMTMRDISFGVTEGQVTFDISQYPGVKVNRK